MSRDEVLAVMELGEQSGSINELEGDILEHLIAQKSLNVKDILTPKEQIFALDQEMTIKEAIKVTNKHEYSRIPLYSNTLDNICLVAYRKNILRAMLDKKKKKPLKDFAKQISRVDENLNLLDLLEKFLFVVINKKEQLVGIVSLDDVIHATLSVGDIQTKSTQNK